MHLIMHCSISLIIVTTVNTLNTYKFIITLCSLNSVIMYITTRYNVLQATLWIILMGSYPLISLCNALYIKVSSKVVPYFLVGNLFIYIFKCEMFES